MHKDKILTIAALIIVLSVDVCAQVVVTSASGKLQGISGEKVVSFRGVPYGKAPVGDLRWKAPSPVEPWSGVRGARLPASRRSTHFKPLGIPKGPHATMACGAPSRSSDLNGQGRPPLQGGEGLKVV
jgi:hypothetical protein